MALVEKHSDKKVATALDKDIFKIVSKIYLVIQSNIVPDTELHDMREPNYMCAASLMEELNKPVSGRNPAIVEVLVSKAVDKLRVCMSRFIKEESLQRLDRIKVYATNNNFLKYILTDESNDGDMGVLRRLLSQVMLQRDSQLHTATQNVQNLRRNTLAKMRVLEPLVSCTNVHEYLEHGDASIYFCDWVFTVQKPVVAHCLTFHLGLHDVRLVKQRENRRTRIAALAEKYIRNQTSSSHLGGWKPTLDDLIARTNASLYEADAEGRDYSEMLLDPIDEFISRELENMFPEFKQSKQWRRFEVEVEQLRKLLVITTENLALSTTGPGEGSAV